MRVLITGAAGFVGAHLVRHLRTCGDECFAFGMPGETFPEQIPSVTGDIAEREDIARALRLFHPDACIHLAGISSVPASWAKPDLAVRVNVTGTVQLLEAVRLECPATRTLVVTSAHVYGMPVGEGLIHEDAPFHPESMYAATKAAADDMARLYARKYGMWVVTVRPVNHFGPGQSSAFVLGSFAEQLVRGCRAGQSLVEIRVGNLESARDFLDVRDVVRAYRLLLEKGRPATAYNLARGEQIKIGDTLERLSKLAGVRVRVVVDPDLFRPTDVVANLNTRRLSEHTGWAPGISLDQSLKDLLAAAEACQTQKKELS